MQLEEHKATKAYILRGHDDLQGVMDEHLARCPSLPTPPHSTVGESTESRHQVYPSSRACFDLFAYLFPCTCTSYITPTCRVRLA